MRQAKARGVVAAGHELTARAAESILREGGNAFDAALAALAAACVAEPVLASLGGGGFLLARPADGRPRVYDFFVETPRRCRPEAEIDFYPILADFGTAQQEFHIGRGSVAVPGLVRGMFAIHRDLASVPMRELVAPAAACAKEGVVLDAFHAYIFSIVGAIYVATPEAAAIYGRPVESGEGMRPMKQGEALVQRELADALESLAIEGEDLFYRGEIAQAIVRDMGDGGQLTDSDLGGYRVELREPLIAEYRGERIATNPPPSSGGLLILFALKLLESMSREAAFDSAMRLERLAGVMELASQARLDAEATGGGLHPHPDRLLDPACIEAYREKIVGARRARRGTTQISIADGDGNVATLSVSNGEGSGYVVPQTGIVLNNMLGEQDLNPQGFYCWAGGQRMTSMMAPTIVQRADGGVFATGSGGSNRIRSAILQVLINLIDFGMDVEDAVRAPRIHFEEGLLSVEGGFERARVAPLLDAFPKHHQWPDLNLFFGGAHTVFARDGEFRGAGDPRRGGVSLVVGG